MSFVGRGSLCNGEWRKFSIEARFGGKEVLGFVLAEAGGQVTILSDFALSFLSKRYNHLTKAGSSTPHPICLEVHKAAAMGVECIGAVQKLFRQYNVADG